TGTKVLVPALAERASRSEAARPADASQLRQRLGRSGCAVVVHAVDGPRASRGNVGVDQLLYHVAPRTGDEGCRCVCFFAVTGIQIVAQSELQGQALGGLPVILEVRTELQVPPVPDVAGQFRVRDRVVLQKPLDRRLRAGWSADPRIDAGVDAVRGVGGEEDRIGEVV